MDILDLAGSVTRLTNWDAHAAPVGSVVIINSVARSFRLASSGFSENVLGVTLDPLQPGWAGLVKLAGEVAAVRVTGSPSVGDYLYSSTALGVAQCSSILRSGAFGRAITTKDLNSCVRAILMPGIGDSPTQVLRVRLLASAAAATFESSIMRAERNCQIDSAYIVTDANITGDNFNFAELSLRNQPSAGEICDIIFSLGKDATAFVPLSFGALDDFNRLLSEGDAVTLRKTIAGAGLATPALLLQLTYHWTI